MQLCWGKWKDMEEEEDNKRNGWMEREDWKNISMDNILLEVSHILLH